MGPLVFKTSVGGEEPPGCVRFAHASAMCEIERPVGFGGTLSVNNAGGTSVARAVKPRGRRETVCEVFEPWGWWR